MQLKTWDSVTKYTLNRKSGFINLLKSDICYSSYFVGKGIDPLVIQVGRIGRIYFQPSNNELVPV